MENKITENEYVPFGDEWYKEVKKLNKETLIHLYRETARAKMDLQYKIDTIIPTNEELTAIRTGFVKNGSAGAEGCFHFTYGIDLIRKRINKLFK